MENFSLCSFGWPRGTKSWLLLIALGSFHLCCFGQLPADLDLPSETINDGYLVFQASNSITNSGSLVVQDPASVTLTAGSYVRLEPGFDAAATNGTATFHAVINSNVVNWQPIPVPDPPAACTDCGLDFVAAAAGMPPPQDIYAPSSTTTLYAVCYDANYDIVSCNLSLSTAAYPNTNGHFHGSPLPPISSISPTSGYTGSYPNYEMPVVLATTQVGQFETIGLAPTNCSEANPCIETNYYYGVGYSGLVYIDNSNIFYQIGGNSSTSHHGDNTFNHWMTVNAATGLQQAATAYINSNNPGQKVCINDMALPFGGKFDIKNNWTSPHKLHDAGTAADVAAISGQCPARYFVNSDRFKLSCSLKGASYVVTEIPSGVVPECPAGSTSCHVHCQWPN